MKHLNCIYTRLIICLLALVVSNVAWGQEAFLKIQDATASPNAINNNHRTSYLYDLNTNNTWSARDDNPISLLEYLQIKNPDRTQDGKRSWIEIPYIPNRNTEVEVRFQNTNAQNDIWHTQYLFGAGMPEFGGGISFGILDSKYAYKTSVHTQLAIGNADTNEHTVVCNAQKAVLDGNTICDFGSYNYTNGNRRLCFFASPDDSQEWARCFEGKIYHVIIRENGVVKYDLLPAKNVEGRCGFYDQISGNFYAFFEMVDYVENENATNDRSHLHIKVPYQAKDDTEIQIRYVNTNPNDDYTSRRHLFSLGTYEEGVMALSTLRKKYRYNSGQILNTTNYSTTINSSTPLTATFKRLQCNVEGNTINTPTDEKSPVWVNSSDFYLFGTHSSNTDEARSFWGRIYGATISSNGKKEIDLQPARNADGVYGFYDKVNKVFYAKENGCGGNENFTGQVTNNADGIPTTSTFNPRFVVNVNLESPQIAKNFIITTAKDKYGDYTNNSPASWTLYGSNGGDQWTELYKYKQIEPKFSSFVADGNTTYFLYNVETGTFFMGKNEWNTRGSLTNNNANEEGWRVRIRNDNGTYRIEDQNRSKNWQWLPLFVIEGSGSVYTDYTDQGNGHPEGWTITSLGNNLYEISNNTIAGGKLGTENADLSNNRINVTTNSKNTTWAFVSESDYYNYINQKNNANWGPMLNGQEYRFPINSNNVEYQQYRLVVDKLVAHNNQINIAELALTPSYDFEHYVGRVYDEANIPNSLKVGGSSGYTSEWKTNTDDVRLNPGVQIQRTHEYEHEVYVLPGETVDLTPFSDFASTGYNATNYREMYVRWYDYNTDLRSDRLTFDKRDGRDVNYLDKGHFAWNITGTDRKSRTREGSLAHYTAVQNTTPDANGVIDVIAIEAANQFGINENTTWDGNSYIIKEPTLQWRHLFVIKDAKARADEMYNNNTNYIESHKITLMCPANTPFQYPLPYNEYASADNSHHTDYYYRNSNNYEPVHHYLIETWQNGTKLGETKVGDDVANGNDQLAYSYKAIENYNRVFYVRNPQEGTYTIKIYALDDNAKNATGNKLQIMEYDLQVLSPENGVMVNAETLMSDSYQYELQRPANMDLTFGKPTTKIDFDDVTINDRTETNGHHYYKWPWQWENSSYGFGYEDRGDYNMYMVADHMSITPYRGRATGAEDFDTYLNVYDRKYYDTGTPGYFFYANAASDPSRMAVLNIGKDFCPNTKVYVSAWINEFQGQNAYAETANVIFSFRGVKADGTEVVLNSFVSGYVSGGWNTPNGYVESKKADDFVNATTNPDNRGKWMHIYYTFTTGNDAEGFDHYIITMENNCTSSEGADYAIDDIRAYVRKPQVKADQLKPVCNGEPSTDLKVFGDFDQLKDAFVLDEKTGDESEIVTFNYCFLDRDLYENELKKQYNESSTIDKTRFTTFEAWREDLKLHTNNYENEYRAAFNKALIKDSYGSGSKEYGTFSMNTNYKKNQLYEYAEGFHPDYYNIAQRQQVGSVRNIIFPCNATDAEMLVGSRYIISMIKETPGRTPNPLDFDLEDKCKSVSDFSVLFSGEIKIDGTLRSDANDLRFCVNQVPVITIDLNGISEGGQPVKTDEAYFDWFFDTPDNYAKATASNDFSISDAIANFRAHYSNMTQEDFASDAQPKGEGQGAFTLENKACIQYFLDNGMLVLYKNSETMSTYDRYMEMANANNNMQLDVTAIPINPHPEDLSIHYCLDPIGISLKLSERTPSMLNGDDSGNIPYPTTMKNVPLRIGLKQLNRVRISNLDENTTPSGILYMPLREVHPYTQGVKSLIQMAEDQLIYLVSSTDPDIAANKSGAINVESYKKTNVKVIGKVSNITASSEDSKKAGNVCHLSFIDAFKFREGYEYTIKFHFEENYTEIQGSHEDVCPGDVVCTIKVVPEYQMWTGAIDANWNNDGNWRRVTKDELLGTAAATADFVTDGGTNDNENSFVPADFTKVIIPADAKNVPKLYDVRTTGNQTVVNYAGAPTSSNFIKDIDAHEANNLIGVATTDIKYDMASIDRADQNVATRSYYDNTCEQIHFNSGAQMLSQQYLYYQKAWADFEVEPNKWSTVASPLINVVSGDLYLPTDGARQMTPLFEDITFNVTDHDRFNPAVFQRRWNAESAKVVHLDGSTTSSIISLDWSEVYNDVNVNYTAGVGFSIKPDVSMMPADKRPEKVKFRLPKADKQYDYWNPNHENTPHNTEVVRWENNPLINGERTHRLADLSNVYTQQVVQNDNTTNYFLVGNPLMCYLDMKRFFDENPSLEREYWIVTGKGQQYAQFDENTEGYVGTVDDAYVAPFQSFFVKLTNTSASTYEPKFNSDMMVALIKDQQGAQRYESVTEQKPESSPVKQFALSLCASDEEGNESVAILTDGAELPTAGLEALFDSNLKMSGYPMLYTNIKGEAMSLAQIMPGDTIPVAMSNVKGNVTLRLTGADTFTTPLYIIDAETGETSLLNGDITLTQSENGVRYYIATDPTGIETETETLLPQIVTKDGVLTIKANGNEISSIMIHKVDGSLITRDTQPSEVFTIQLPRNVYLIHLICNGKELTYKIAM